MEVVQGKSSREVGASLGGSGHLRGCMERLLGFLQEPLEFQNISPEMDTARRGEVMEEDVSSSP